MTKKKEVKIEIDIVQDAGAIKQRLKGEIRFYVDEGLEEVIPYLLQNLKVNFNANKDG